MLLALRVHDFILIDEFEIQLEPGFNVITGETGAGKSIIIGALNLVLGGRARADMVRPGAAEAVVEALFDLSGSPGFSQSLEEAGVHSDGELVIRRVVQLNGRSRAYLNGRLCTVAELSAVATELADVTSQHESVALTDASRHIHYLDQYAKLLGERDKLNGVFSDLLEVERELEAAHARARGRAEREAFLRFQLDAIEKLEPQDGELDDLQNERNRLKHAERLIALTGEVAEQLDHDLSHATKGQRSLPICDRLGRLATALATAAELDPSLEGAQQELEDCWERLRDLADQVARYNERIESEPSRLADVQDRIYQLEGLLRQHGPQLSDVLAAQDRILTELSELTESENRIPGLQQGRAKLFAQATQLARKLSIRRQKAALKLGKKISSELAQLGMGTARVVVDVRPTADDGSQLVVDDARLSRDGIDRVQFLIAPNKGLEPRPLRKIASGGELSRALLALKLSLNGCDNQPCRSMGIQVLDEVDAGVGGATADKIGRAIAGIARQRQVLCITHLAAIAVYGDAHFVVSKDDEEGITLSRIKRVVEKLRTYEVARMLTGDAITASSRKAAQELLLSARSDISDAAE